MTPERVLAALEAGAMLSMASGRTGAERRAIAEFVTGKTFAGSVQHEAVAAGDVPRGGRRVREPACGPAVERLGRRTRRTRDIRTAPRPA